MWAELGCCVSDWTLDYVPSIFVTLQKRSTKNDKNIKILNSKLICLIHTDYLPCSNSLSVNLEAGASMTKWLANSWPGRSEWNRRNMLVANFSAMCKSKQAKSVVASNLHAPFAEEPGGMREKSKNNADVLLKPHTSLPPSCSTKDDITKKVTYRIR